MATVTTTARGMLFDMDGVLISSIASATRCWQRWAKLYDVPNADTFVLPHGRPARDIVTMLRPDINPDEGLRVIEDMEIEDVGDIEVLPGVRELLTLLPPERWTVVTSCTRRLLEARLRAAGLPEPPKLVAADDITHGKPHPEPYLAGAAALGLRPDDCIVVEDAVSGVEAGRAAGCRVLAVLSSTAKSELAAADWIAQSLYTVNVAVKDDALELTIPLAD